MTARTAASIMSETEVPSVAIDHDGIFVFINDAFTRTYGWTGEDLLGELITKIMPPHMRDAHNFGFSRFLTTETPRILDQRLELPVIHADGRTVLSSLYITSEKKQDGWMFAATLEPLPQETKKE